MYIYIYIFIYMSFFLHMSNLDFLVSNIFHLYQLQKLIANVSLNDLKKFSTATKDCKLLSENFHA